METTITFHTKNEDKKKLVLLAESMGLSLSSFCRVNMLKILKENQEVENGSR